MSGRDTVYIIKYLLERTFYIPGTGQYVNGGIRIKFRFRRRGGQIRLRNLHPRLRKEVRHQYRRRRHEDLPHRHEGGRVKDELVGEVVVKSEDVTCPSVWLGNASQIHISSVAHSEAINYCMSMLARETHTSLWEILWCFSHQTLASLFLYHCNAVVAFPKAVAAGLPMAVARGGMFQIIELWRVGTEIL